MLIKDKDGNLIDTHEGFYDERDTEIQDIGDDIIEEFEESFIEHCRCAVEGDDFRKWVIVEDAPNYDKLLEEIIQEHITEKTDEQFIEDLREYVKDNVASEDTLCDRAIEEYNERGDYYEW